MKDFLGALRNGTVMADEAMGSYLFERTGRLSEINHVYKALNVLNPELILEVHLLNLKAGARCLTTNTFEANRTRLTQFGEGERAAELNRAGVALAREAIAAFRKDTGADYPLFVLGSVGPTPTGGESAAEATDTYREQVSTLVFEGVDAILLETFTSTAHMKAVLALVKAF